MNKVWILPNISKSFINLSRFKQFPKSSTHLSQTTDKANGTVQLSDSCIKKLKEVCLNGSFLRITVEGGGCSGFQYKFEIDTKMNEDDLLFGANNAKVVVDSVSLEYCSGSTIDYHSELIKSGFRIIGNPKAEQGCSCGASFSIKIN